MSNDHDRSASRGVFILAALIACCLSAVFIAGATAERLQSALGHRLSSQVTILVWAQGLESADAAAARAAELLAGQSGGRRTAVLEPDDMDVTIGEIIIGRNRGDGGPRLIVLSGTSASMPSALDLRRVLKDKHIAAAIVDRRGVFGPLEMRALIADALAIVLSVALCGTLFVVSFLSGGGAVGAARKGVDLMIRLGADPAFIGAIVGRRQSVMALAGGVIGALCADLCLVAANFVHGFWRSLGAPTLIQPHLSDGLWSAVSLPAVMAIAAVGGVLGARRGIVRRERRL